MKCSIHNIEMQVICGEDVCASCYGEQLLKEPLPKKISHTELEIVYDITRHRDIVRKKKK